MVLDGKHQAAGEVKAFPRRAAENPDRALNVSCLYILKVAQDFSNCRSQYAPLHSPGELKHTFFINNQSIPLPGK